MEPLRKDVSCVKRAVTVGLLVLDLVLLPCAFVTVFRFAALFVPLRETFWTRAFLGWTLPVVFLRCLYLPYAAAAVLLPLSAAVLIRARSRRAAILCLAAVCILGLLSLEAVFAAAMGI